MACVLCTREALHICQMYKHALKTTCVKCFHNMLQASGPGIPIQQALDQQQYICFLEEQLLEKASRQDVQDTSLAKLESQLDVASFAKVSCC